MLDANLDSRAATLNARYRNHAAVQVLRHALSDPDLGRVALVLGIWCVVGLVLCIRTFRWQDR